MTTEKQKSQKEKQKTEKTPPNQKPKKELECVG